MALAATSFTRVIYTSIHYLRTHTAPSSFPASLWQNAIAAARATIASHYRVTTSWQDVNRSINIRGLGFFDELHAQSGVAPNGIELHPVTHIRIRLGVAPGSAAPAADAGE